MTAAPMIRIAGVRKSFGESLALDGVELEVQPGEFFSLLGASGCGKTTLLRLIAGLERPDSGQVVIDGNDMTATPPWSRPVNTVFQSYALFPHLSVAGNVAFGLKQERLPRAEIARRTDEALALVDLRALAGRKPDELSGGQRQRVALARALAKRPKILLLDEPMAALDRRLREQTRFELVGLQQRLGITFLMVTHDQEEAMSLSGRIAVMEAGRIVQCGTPREIYERPASRFVAGFVGDANLVTGRATGMEYGLLFVRCDGTGETVTVTAAPGDRPRGAVTIMVRPERARLHSARPAVPSMAGEIVATAFLGASCLVRVRLSDGSPFELRLPDSAALRHRRTGEAVWVGWEPQDARLLPS